MGRCSASPSNTPRSGPSWWIDSGPANAPAHTHEPTEDHRDAFQMVIDRLEGDRALRASQVEWNDQPTRWGELSHPRW
jgi:hypothetical protein